MCNVCIHINAYMHLRQETRKMGTYCSHECLHHRNLSQSFPCPLPWWWHLELREQHHKTTKSHDTSLARASLCRLVEAACMYVCVCVYCYMCIGPRYMPSFGITMSPCWSCMYVYMCVHTHTHTHTHIVICALGHDTCLPLASLCDLIRTCMYVMYAFLCMYVCLSMCVEPQYITLSHGLI